MFALIKEKREGENKWCIPKEKSWEKTAARKKK